MGRAQRRQAEIRARGAAPHVGTTGLTSGLLAAGKPDARTRTRTPASRTFTLRPTETV